MVAGRCADGPLARRPIVYRPGLWYALLRWRRRARRLEGCAVRSILASVPLPAYLPRRLVLTVQTSCHFQTTVGSGSRHLSAHCCKIGRKGAYLRTLRVQSTMQVGIRKAECRALRRAVRRVRSPSSQACRERLVGGRAHCNPVGWQGCPPAWLELLHTTYRAEGSHEKRNPPAGCPAGGRAREGNPGGGLSPRGSGWIAAG